MPVFGNSFSVLVSRNLPVGPPGTGRFKPSSGRFEFRSRLQYPSLSNSPWMRGAPQSRLAMLIWRMRSRISVLCSSWADPEAGSRSPAPIEPEALAIPLDHGRRLHQYHRVQGRRPDDFEDTRGCVEPQLAHGVGPYIASRRRIRVLGV